jgi:Ran GTPase-activating protein (RanGAP) involved in mRNA processing and transport
MTTYTSLPNVIHGEIIKCLSNDSLLKLRSVSKQLKKYVKNYGKYILSAFNLAEYYGLNVINDKKRMFKKLLFNIDISRRYNQNPSWIDINDIIILLKTDNIIIKLIMFDVGIGKELEITLSNALKVTSLQELSISYNNIDRTTISEALKVNTSLQKLSISSTNIGPEGGLAIGSALKVNTSLQKLVMNNNKIGPEGGSAIGSALKVNTTLQELQIGSNKLGSEGVFAIASALKVNTSLQILCINCNNICDKGGFAIGSALKVNTSLQRLYINDNNLGFECQQQLQDIATTKKDFKLYL